MTDEPKDPKKVKAGRKGGKTTARKYGKEYMQALGRRGALAFHAKYKLQPAEMNNFAIVSRTTGEIVGYLNGNHVTHRPGKEPQQ